MNESAPHFLCIDNRDKAAITRNCIMKEYLNGFLVFIAVVVVPIVIHSMIVYGKTNENIDEQYFLGYSIGDDFNDLPNDRKTIIKTGYIGNFSIASYSDRIVYTLEDDEDAK